MFKSLFGLVSANLVAQLVNFSGITLISGWVGPEMYGGYLYGLGFSMILTSVMTLKGDNLVYASKGGEDAWQVVCAIFSSISYQFAILAVIGGFFYCFFSSSSWGILLFGLMAAATNSVFVTMNSFLIKIKKHELYSITVIVRPILTFCFQVGAVLVFPKAFSLLLCRVLSDSAISLVRVVRETQGKVKFLTPGELCEFIVKNSTYCVSGTLSSLINVLNQQAVILLMPLRYGLDDVGKFGLSLSLVVAPIAIINAPLRGLVIKRLSENSVERVFFLRKLTVICAIFALFAFCVVYWGSDLFFEKVWDSRWDGLSELVTILSVWSLSSLVSSPYYASLVEMKKQAQILALEILIFFTRVSLILVSAFFDFDVLIMAALIVATAVVYNFSIITLGACSLGRYSHKTIYAQKN